VIHSAVRQNQRAYPRGDGSFRFNAKAFDRFLQSFSSLSSGPGCVQNRVRMIDIFEVLEGFKLIAFACKIVPFPAKAEHLFCLEMRITFQVLPKS
jgi:hypothetical protein